MATRPLPEAAAGPPSAPYIEELHEFFVTSHVPFGSPADLAPIAARMSEPGAFSDDLSSLLRSFVLRQGGAMPHAQLLEILTIAIAGHEPIDDPPQYIEPLRQLLAFVAAVMRRPWNAPPGERTEVLPFPDVLSAPSPAIDPVTAATIPRPVPPNPAPPMPVPPPQDIPEPSPPPSAIAAALAESKRMAPPPEPALLAGSMRKSRSAPQPVHREPHPEPVLFLRAADVPRAASEPDLDPTFDAGLDRTSPVFRSVLVVAVLAAAVALFFVFSGRKPADIFGRIHPLAAFARLESMVHRPSTPPASEQPSASPSLTVPNPSTGNAPPAPQPAPQSTTTPSAADASAQPAPGTHLSTGTPQPATPRHSAYVAPLHHPEPAATSWTYPEPNPPKPTPVVHAPAAAAHLAPSAPLQPAATYRAPSAPPQAAATVNPPSNPGQYAPYRPSPSDQSYEPYHPNSDADRTPQQALPTQTPPAETPAEPPAQSPTQNSPRTELQAPSPAPAQAPSATPDRGTEVAGIGLGMTPGGPPHRPLSEPAKEIQPSFYSVSSHVMEANLISSPGPDYPAYARATHVQGQVTMEAVIDKQGNVSSIRILTGHHLLREAAEDAVRRWRYRPYVVNGQPVEVATIVTVDFHNPS